MFRQKKENYTEQVGKGTTVINFESQHYNEKTIPKKIGGEKDIFFNNNLSWPEFIRISFSFANCLQFAESHSFMPA